MSIFDRANRYAQDEPVEFLERLFPGKTFDRHVQCPECEVWGKFGVMGCFRITCRLGGPMTPVYFTALVRDTRPIKAAKWMLKEADDERGLAGLIAQTKRMAVWRPRTKEETVRVALPGELRDLPDSAYYYLEDRGLSWTTMEEFGLSWCNKGRWRGRIIIPVEDMFFTARTIQRHVEPKYLFPKGAKKSMALFNAPAGDHAIVVEGVMDAMLWNQYGFPACAIFGAKLSRNQCRQLIRRYSRVTICLDGDRAGRKGTKDAVRRLEGIVQELRVVMFDDGYDPADCHPEEVLPGVPVRTSGVRSLERRAKSMMGGSG